MTTPISPTVTGDRCAACGDPMAANPVFGPVHSDRQHPYGLPRHLDGHDHAAR